MINVNLTVPAKYKSSHYSISLLILGVIHDILNVDQSDGYIKIAQYFSLYSVDHH